MAVNPCPSCGMPITVDDINVREGVGLCRSCGKLSRLAEIADQPAIDASAVLTPPPGCSIETLPGGGQAVRASLRSAGNAAVTLVSCLFWNTIVSLFVLTAIEGLYLRLVGPLPPWFPAPQAGTKDMPLGGVLFLCLFLVPFVLIGLGLVATSLTYLMGRVEVVLAGSHGIIRTGTGPFNWTRRFDPAAVLRVSGSRTSHSVNDEAKALITIEADRTIRFGSLLEDRRREWMTSVLHLFLVTSRQVAQRTSGQTLSSRK